MTQLIDLGKLRFYFAGEYADGTTYEINDVVKYGGNVYIYISVISAAGNLPTDTAYWSLMLRGINFEGPYVPGTAYQIGDGVAHGGTVYIAIANNQNNTPPNATYWSKFVDGIQYEGIWSNATTYQKNDVVKYGAKAYIAKVDGAGYLPTNATYWDPLVDGIAAEGVFNSATAYVPGDVTAYGANTYVCILETTGNVPTDATYWSPFTGGISYKGEWTTTTQYYPNDVVNRGGRTFIALLASVSSVFATDLDESKWQAFNGGLRITGNFQPSYAYLTGDVAFDGISSYVANQDFTSGGTVSADVAKWDLLAQGADYLPGQVNNQGKILSTDGTDALWTYEINKVLVGLDAADFETSADLTNPVAVFSSNEDDYTQVSLVNLGNGADSSTDLIVYANNGDDTSGWIDMGMTSQSFNDPSFTITGVNDGYIFVSGADTKTATPASYTRASNVVTLTTTAAHNFNLNTKVTVTTPVTGINGLKTITAIPSSTTLQFASSGSAVSSPASLTGSVVAAGGTGNLVLATDGTGSQNKIIFAAGGLATDNTQMAITPDLNIHIEIATPSTSPTTGALTIVGGVGVQGDIYTLGTLNIEGISYIGESARSSSDIVGTNVKAITNRSLTNNVVTITTSAVHNYGAYQEVTIAGVNATFNGTYEIVAAPTTTTFTYAKTADDVASVASGGTVTATVGFTNAMGIFGADADDYAQVISYNINNSVDSSADFIAYPDNGSDFAGYIDMGITSSTFDDPEFTITGPNDGYIFMTAPIGSPGNGNLVLATGSYGLQNKIIFAAGGLESDNTQMEITPDVNVHIEISTPSTSPTTGALTVVGGVGISGNMNIAGNVNIVGTITFGGQGTTVETANLAVADPFIFIASNNPANVLDFGVLGESNLPTTLDPQAAVTTKAIVGSTDTVTLGITYSGGSEPFKIGDSIVVTGVDATINGTRTVTAVTGSSVSFVVAGTSDLAQTAASTNVVKTVTLKSLTNAVATLTTSVAHTYTVGESVVIAGVDSTFNGTYTIAAVTSGTFSYANAVADVSETAATTAVTKSVTNKELTSNVATLTTDTAHGYQVGNSVVVSAINATFDGTYTITSVTSTTFSYSLVDTDVASSGAAGSALVNALLGTTSVTRLLGAANATDVLRTRYSGFAKDVTDGTWKLFSGAITKPVTTVNFAEDGVIYDPLKVGNLTAQSITILGTPSASTDATTVAYVNDVAGGSWTALTASATAVKGGKYFANTSGGSFTLTLPAAPTVNSSVRVADLAGTWNVRPLTIGRNSTKIQNLPENLILDVKDASIELVYSGATYGWRLV